MTKRVDKGLRSQTHFLPTDFAFVNNWVYLSGGQDEDERKGRQEFEKPDTLPPH